MAPLPPGTQRRNMADFIILDFRTEYKGDKAVDYVLVGPKGEALERTKTWHRVKDITPPENLDPDHAATPTMVDILERWKTIGPAYAAYKSGMDVPDVGLPLAAWSGVSVEQAAVLRRLGIKTVEDVANMSESTATKLPFPNARKLSGLAAEFLSGKSKADTEAELADMREKMLAMEEMLAEQMAEKRKPGRPRKEAEAA